MFLPQKKFPKKAKFIEFLTKKLLDPRIFILEAILDPFRLTFPPDPELLPPRAGLLPIRSQFHSYMVLSDILFIESRHCVLHIIKVRLGVLERTPVPEGSGVH